MSKVILGLTDIVAVTMRDRKPPKPITQSLENTLNKEQWAAALAAEEGRDVLIPMEGTIILCYPRSWYQFSKDGWYRHIDGFGQKCWIRFNWPEGIHEQLEK